MFFYFLTICLLFLSKVMILYDYSQYNKYQVTFTSHALLIVFIISLCAGISYIEFMKNGQSLQLNQLQVWDLSSFGKY